MFPFPPTLTLEMGIASRGKDLKVMGHLSPSHKWDIHRHCLFLLTPPWARGDSIDPMVPHKPLLLYNQVGRARAWVEVGDRAHKTEL